MCSRAVQMVTHVGLLGAVGYLVGGDASPGCAVGLSNPLTVGALAGEQAGSSHRGAEQG